MEIRKLIAIALLCLSGTSVFGQVHFWMSVNGVAAGSPAPLAGQVPEIDRPLGTSGEINIWVRPELNKTLQNFSLNVESTSETAIEFQSAVIANGGRFSSVFDTSNGLDIADQAICGLDEPLHAIWGLAGFSVDADGGTGLNAVSPGDDPYYDATNNSWLLATIVYRAAELGSTELYLEVGQIGLNQRDNLSDMPDSSTATRVLIGDPSDPTSSAGFLERCQRSSTSEATIHVVDSLKFPLGDFNMNGILDAPDIDLLSAEVIAGTNRLEYRLDGDLLVDQNDRVVWVEALKKSRFGDVDLNGTVEFVDFLVMSDNFGLPGGWAAGDFTGDGSVGFDDFLTLSANFGLSGSAHPVPEPNGSLLLSGFFAVLGLRRRR